MTEVKWSNEFEQASWIAERTDDWAHFSTWSIIPRGFEAYARILHPAKTSGPTPHTVRWSEIAEWSGLPFESDSSFEDIALPLDVREGRKPWHAPPREGALDSEGLNALLDVLGPHSAESERFFFCLWEGLGWDSSFSFGSRPGEPSSRLPDPIPPEVRNGPRVSLPNRNYLLYEGALDEASAWMESKEQSPNLWWPEDRSWCVASAIDFPWTYVAGTSDLVSDLLSKARLETQSVEPNSSPHPKDDRLLPVAAEAARELLESGKATVTTGVGILECWLDRPILWGAGRFHYRYRTAGSDSWGSGSSVVARNVDHDMLTKIIRVEVQHLCS